MTKLTSTRRAALIGGAAAAAFATEASAQLSPGSLLNRLTNQQTQQTATPEQQTPAISAGRQELALRGYALSIVPVRALMATGDYAGAMSLYRQPPAATPTPASADGTTAPQPQPTTLFSSSDIFLCNSELGLMNFDAASFPESTTFFATANDAATADQQQQSGNVLQRMRRGANRLFRRTAAFMTGRDELAIYQQRDYERILQLNYLALSYLVAGDRRAYNVNRLAIEEQDLARRNFEEEIGEAQERLTTARNDGANGAKAGNVTDAFAQEFTQYDRVSGRVPSAYVNPMGFYLSGVIQEITSVQRPSLRGTARASYEQALALAGTSAQMSSAITAMQTPPEPGERILHIIVGEGFAPSRQALLYGVQLDQQVIPVRIPIFTPSPSAVTRMQLVDGTGRPVARLDSCGDIEAMVMRSQHDRMPQMLLGVIASAWRSSAEQRWAAGMGEIASSVMTYKQNFDSPDMRSWATLPGKFHIARVRLPAGQTRFRLQSFAGARMLHTTTLTAPADLQHCVAYGRVMDGALTIEQPRRLWIDGIDEEAATP